MIIDTSGKCAIFDPSLAAAGKVHPHPSDDSRFEVNDAGIAIQRGNGDRLVGYFKVDPKFASIRVQEHFVTLQYADAGRGEWFIEYVARQADSNNTYPWAATERVKLTATNSKMEVCLRIDHARLTGHVNGADFRIVIVDADIDAFDMYNLRITPGKASDDSSSMFVYPAPDRPITFEKTVNPQASIVIPVYNELDYTLDCLRAISEFTAPAYEVVVIDNASTDGTAQALSAIANLTVISNSENIGFGRACNQGAEHSSGEYVVFLNNDTLPQPGWLGSLIACAERHADAGVVGSRLIFPQTDEIQSAGVRFGRYLLPEDEYQNFPVDAPEVSVDQEVEALCGASILIKRSLFQSYSGFDERFLNGLEDVDFCLRLRKNNQRNMLCAGSNVLHYKSATEGRFGLEKDRANVSLFHEKWHPYLSGITKTNDESQIALGQLPRRFDANFKDLNNQTGRRINGSIKCLRSNDAPGHCVYGPYLRLADAFPAVVTFNMSISELVEESGDLISLDVYDSVSDQVLAEQTLRTGDVDTGSMSPALEFDADISQILEFRVYWHGNCDLAFTGLEINTSL